MEGKEVRFGIANSALFTTVTTDASCGAVNTMHDSLMPLGGMVPMVNIMLGEIIFGGVGSGLYGMLLFAVLAVFIAGLMVGRTPEYLGKKIECEGGQDGDARHPRSCRCRSSASPRSRRCCRPASRASAIPARTASARSSTPSPRRPGTTAAPLPGSARTRPSTTRRLGLAMFIGRFLMIVPMLAIAGSLAAKKIVPASAGTFPTDGGAVCRPADRRHRDHRRAHLLPGRVARPRRRAAGDARRHPLLRLERAHPMSTMDLIQTRSRTAATTLTDTKIVIPAIGEAFKKLDPADDDPQSGDVRCRGGRDADDAPLPARSRSPAPAITASRSRSISGSGSPCSSRTSPKRSRKAAARRRRRRCGAPRPKPWRSCSRRKEQRVARGRRHVAEAGRCRARRDRRHDPQRRRGHRGRRLGQRSGDHRRVRPGHPRERRRPLGGHRRHAGHLRLDQGAHHRGARVRPSSTA